jgi:nucleotide-binding universal stress UspA family protein
MLKRILVPLDTSEYTTAATRMAAHIANRERDATQEEVILFGLGIVDMDQVPTGRFASLVPREQLLKEAEEKVAELTASFKSQVQALGIHAGSVETATLTGSPFRGIIRESVFCDLIVMGQKCSFPPVNFDYDTMHELYHQASRPIILTDQNFDAVHTVVLAMDGTAPASRMMYAFAHLNPFPQAEVVLSYSRLEEKEYGLQDFFKRVLEFLRSHHYKVRASPYEGEMEADIGGLMEREKAQILAFGIHREDFLTRLSDPLRIRESYAKRLLRSIPGSLFIVH